jgi:hypothetical protein
VRNRLPQMVICQVRGDTTMKATGGEEHQCWPTTADCTFYKLRLVILGIEVVCTMVMERVRSGLDAGPIRCKRMPGAVVASLGVAVCQPNLFEPPSPSFETDLIPHVRVLRAYILSASHSIRSQPRPGIHSRPPPRVATSAMIDRR